MISKEYAQAIADYPTGAVELMYPPSGEYFVMHGDEDPIHFDPERLQFGRPVSELPGPMLGVSYRGVYHDALTGIDLDVVSFLYDEYGGYGETDTIGTSEIEEQLVIWRGSGCGEHPRHAGQEPSWYIIGTHIGSYRAVSIGQEDITVINGSEQLFDVKVGVYSPLLSDGDEAVANHFSIRRIKDGPYGPPISANLPQIEG